MRGFANIVKMGARLELSPDALPGPFVDVDEGGGGGADQLTANRCARVADVLKTRYAHVTGVAQSTQAIASEGDVRVVSALHDDEAMGRASERDVQRVGVGQPGDADSDDYSSLHPLRRVPGEHAQFTDRDTFVDGIGAVDMQRSLHAVPVAELVEQSG